MILYNDDCLNVLKELEDNSIDLILQDPPYNTTNCAWEWDIMTKIDEFWKEWNRVIKPNGAIVMFGSEPFSSKLRLSNLKNYRYDWIWGKKSAGNILVAKYQPLKTHEIISVFSIEKNNYYPQYTYGHKDRTDEKARTQKSELNQKMKSGVFQASKTNKPLDAKYPKSIVEFSKQASECSNSKSIHPTQKPVALLEYLIKTYTQENETVFDGFSGSCSTGIACLNTNRQFIGVELDEHYYTIGKQRVDEHLANLSRV